MRSVLLVVLDLLGQDRLQVPPIHDQPPGQALAADMDPGVRTEHSHSAPALECG